MKRQGEELQKHCAETTTTLKALNDTLRGLGTWVPQVGETIKGIQTTLNTMGTHLEVLETERRLTTWSHSPPPTTGETEQVQLPSALKVVVPQRESSRRDVAHTPIHFELCERSGAFEDSGYPESRSGHHRSRPPKTDFPRFDGDNPRWWKSVCEKYFALYSVEHETWASFATMHFVGNAALWLQTYEAEHDVYS